MNKLLIRRASLSDVDELVSLDHKVWGEGSRTDRQMWVSRIKTFAEGVIVGEIDSRIIGVVVLELLDHYDFSKPETWYEITNNGTLVGKHDSRGKIVYGVAFSIDPTLQNLGIGTKLSTFVWKWVFEKNMERLLLGARLVNYQHWNTEISPEEYIHRAFSKDERIDPELNFYKKFGFRPRAVIADYFYDPSSKHYGVLIERKNSLYNNPLRLLVAKVILPLILFFQNVKVQY